MCRDSAVSRCQLTLNSAQEAPSILCQMHISRPMCRQLRIADRPLAIAQLEKGISVQNPHRCIAPGEWNVPRYRGRKQSQKALHGCSQARVELDATILGTLRSSINGSREGFAKLSPKRSGEKTKFPSQPSSLVRSQTILKQSLAQSATQLGDSGFRRLHCDAGILNANDDAL